VSDTVTPTEPSDTKPCKVCGEEIKKTARKCIHCDSYQDWRGSVSLSQTVLALLIALISVTTSAIPVLRDSLFTKNAAIRVAFEGANDKVITFLVSNIGTRPGSISRTMTLLLPTEQGDLFVTLLSSEEVNSSAILLEQNKSLLLHFIYSPKDQNRAFPTAIARNDLYKTIKNDLCNLTGEGTDFLAEVHPINLRVKCSEISSFLFNSIPLLP
jgi:hypothetical protein